MTFKVLGLGVNPQRLCKTKPQMDLQCSAQNKCVKFYMTDGSPPPTYLNFIPADLHLDKSAYLRRGSALNVALLGGHVGI